MKRTKLTKTEFVVSLLVFISVSSFAATTYTNPIISERLADPEIFFEQGTYYLYATGRGYPTYTSTDLVNWTSIGQVFSEYDKLWAPDIYKHTDGKFYLTFTAPGTGGGVGIASGSSPTGPFTVLVDSMGAIDGHLFRDDDGQLYLYWTEKTAGWMIQVQKMIAPGVPSNKIISLFKPSQAWDHPINEGPEMVKHKGTYYLMFSGNGASTPKYALGYATSNSPTGPFTKFEGNPILRNEMLYGIYGPGHHAVTKDKNGTYWMVYHQKDSSTIGWPRKLAIDPMWFDSSGVIHCRPTRNELRPAPNTEVWPKRIATSPIQFEKNDGRNGNGVIKEITAPACTVAAMENNTYIAFRNVDFNKTEKSFEVRASVSHPVDKDVIVQTIELRTGGINGPVLGTCNVTGTGFSDTRFVTFRGDLKFPISGNHDIIVRITNTSLSKTPISCLDWFKFSNSILVR